MGAFNSGEIHIKITIYWMTFKIITIFKKTNTYLVPISSEQRLSNTSEFINPPPTNFKACVFLALIL